MSEIFSLLCDTISFNIILGFFIYTSLRMQAVSLLGVRNGREGGGDFYDPKCGQNWLRFQTRSQNCEKRLLASSCLSDRMKQPGFRWTDCHEIWYFNTFRNHVEKIQVPLKSHKNNGGTWQEDRWCKQPKRCNKFCLLTFLLLFLIQLYMFRATNSPILMSTFWLYIQLLVQCSDIAADRQQYRCSQKVLMKMGEFVARNM